VKASRRVTLVAVAAICTAVAFTTTSAPAHATGVANNYASKSKISATVGPNSWSTPKYGVSSFAENFVTVGSLGGACGSFCYWWEKVSIHPDGQRVTVALV
jgi:hypothetical protein